MLYTAGTTHYILLPIWLLLACIITFHIRYMGIGSTQSRQTRCTFCGAFSHKRQRWNDRLCAASNREKCHPSISPLLRSLGGSVRKLYTAEYEMTRASYRLAHYKMCGRTTTKICAAGRMAAAAEKIRYHNLWIVRCYCFGFCSLQWPSFASQSTSLFIG